MKDNIEVPGYHVTKDGDVFSRRVKGPKIRLGDTWFKLKPPSDNFGRKILILKDLDGQKKNFKVHRLVLQAYVGPCPEGLECCHNDGNPSNNKLENLRWDTKQNNVKDKRRHGTILSGEKAGSSKLKEKDIIDIKTLRETTDLSYSKIGKIYNVDGSTIYKIVKNKRWKHLNSQK